MKLHSLKKIVAPSAKRLGRGIGSGVGTKSGRGTTRHQSAREKIPTHFEGGQNRLVKKFPYLRGKGKNRSYQSRPYVVDFEKLANWPIDLEVNIENLLSRRIINKSDAKNGVKLASGGEAKALLVNIPTTKAAVTKLEKIGGKIISL
mgnify:CR=1 FL=1